LDFFRVESIRKEDMTLAAATDRVRPGARAITLSGDLGGKLVFPEIPIRRHPEGDSTGEVVVRVPHGVSERVLQFDAGRWPRMAHVRITDGSHAGAVGWVSVFFIRWEGTEQV